MLHCLEQLGKYVASVFDNARQIVEHTHGLPCVLAFEFSEPVNLKLFLRARCADNRHLRRRSLGPVSVQADDRPRAVINLPFVPVRARLNLAALIPVLERAEHAAELVDFAEFIQGSLLRVRVPKSSCRASR